MAKNLIVHQNRIRRAIISIEWILLFAGFVLGMLVPYFLQRIGAEHVAGFLNDLVPEAVGIFFTVAILERLSARREARSLRQQLVRRVHSRHNNTALSAIEELRVLGELERGILSDLKLRGSNWQDANLYQTDLTGCDLTNADLRRADLVEANLTGATITDEQLASTDVMRHAIMPSGKRYDGRYRLLGDNIRAEKAGKNPDDPEHMAPWYGVSLDDYIDGQAWANRNLHTFKHRTTIYDLDDPQNNYDNALPIISPFITT